MLYVDVDTAVTVPVNVLPLIDDGDFKTIEESVAYNAAGMDLNWNFVTSAGVVTQTNVTPTTGGVYDWTHVGNGMYKIEIPASGGGSINNDTKGYGWFSGVCDGVLPWCGPRICFRAAALNDALCDGGDTLDVNVAEIAGDSGAAQESLFADGKVYVATGGTSNTTWPTGSACQPTDTIARGQTIAAARNLYTLLIYGSHTLTQALENVHVVGHGHIEYAHRIDINGQSIEHAVFERLVIQGAGGNAVGLLNATRYTNCLLWAHTNINGMAMGCGMSGACSILDGGSATLVDVAFGTMAACTLDLQNPATCTIINMRGTLTLTGLDGDTAPVNISMQNGALLTIDNTCTAGTINITGSGTVTDNSGAGCTVNITVPEADVAKLDGSTTLPEITGASDTPAEPTPGQALMLLYQWLRNNTQSTATSRAVKNDAGTTVLSSVSSDVSGTFSQGKLS